MSQAMTARPALDVGRVFTRAFVLLGRAFLPVFLTTWSVGVLMAVVTVAVSLIMQADFAAARGPGAGLPASTWLAFLVVYGGLALQYGMAVCATTQGALMIDNGEKPTIMRVFLGSLGGLVPVTCVGVLYALMWSLATVFFVIPGVFVRLFWIVAGPARAGERMFFLNAFARSARLTSGAWWPIFLVQLIWGVGMLMLLGVALWGMVATALRVAVVAGGTFGSATLTPQGGAILLAYQLVTSAIFTLLLMLNAAMPAALYAELRSLRDGFTSKRLDQVFS
jgi:hypothetical protein